MFLFLCGLCAGIPIGGYLMWAYARYAWIRGEIRDVLQTSNDYGGDSERGDGNGGTYYL